jgi:glycosyltransferase involved in cell wall biosynthesis
MTANPLVSVIVPVYNAEKYLRGCLDGILRQTYANLEIICVDDGSTDNSASILNEYARVDNRFIVVSQENGGVGSARNFGYKHATGKYVQWLDSDDFFDPDMVTLLAEKAEQTNADITLCGITCYDESKRQPCNSHSAVNYGITLAPENQPFSYTDCPNHIFQIMGTHVWNKLFKKEFLDNNNLRFDAIPMTEDQYVSNISAVLAARIAVINSPLYTYRINTGISLCDRRTLFPDFAYKAAEPIINKLKELGVYEDVRQSYHNLILPSIRYFYDGMATFGAFEYLHNKLRGEIFEQLGVVGLPEDYFYDYRTHKWLRMVMENTAADVAFNAAYAWSRKYGKVAATTFILRE